MIKRILFGVLAVAVGMSCALAASVTTFSPQGVVARIQNIQVDFDRDVVALGEAQANAPFEVNCDEDKLTGTGRWIDARHWVYEFARMPAAGVSCTATVASNFRDLKGRVIEGEQSYVFSTGGPRTRSRTPWSGNIDEDQVFVLTFNAEVKAESVSANTWCRVQGIGEAIAVRLIEGEARRQILLANYMKDRIDDPSVQLLQCKRTLPAGAQMQLRIQPGVQTLGAAGRAEFASVRGEIFKYKVRESFTAAMTCIRENAKAPCSPLGRMALEFSAPVAAESLRQIVLDTPAGPRRADGVDKMGSDALQSVTFKGPFPEKNTLTFRLPEDFRDDAGRVLTNAASFPLNLETADFPSLLKFSSGTFGIVERFGSEAEKSGKESAMVPLTLRRVGTDTIVKNLEISAGTVRDHVTADDARAFQWYARVQRLDETYLTAMQIEDVRASRALSDSGDKPVYLDTRSVPMFTGQEATQTLQLPGLDSNQELEVIGLPLRGPGLHVIEVESASLGASLLEHTTPMYVRTAVLLTNMAVHIKVGRDDLTTWVTTLEDGLPVADAQVAVLTCAGKLIAQGRTDPSGVWHQIERPEAPDYCQETNMSGLFVTARIPADHPQAGGQADFSFAMSSWNQGIEPWRFNTRMDTSHNPDMAVHAVFDRTLLRAGETVSMKFFARELTRHGLENPPAARLPGRATIEHMGSEDSYDLDLQWALSPSGGQSSQAIFVLPSGAKLGEYSVTLVGKKLPTDEQWQGDPSYEAGSFRVEAFKLPLLTGTLKLSDAAGSGILVAPEDARVDIQLEYVSGGAAGKLPVSLSAVATERAVSFEAYDDYSFGVPDWMHNGTAQQSAEEASEGVRALILDKQSVVLDEHGGGRVVLDGLPRATTPQSWLVEASFADPNGEVRTIAQTVPVWPAEVVAGVRAGGWLPAGRQASLDLLALDVRGKPIVGVVMSLEGKLRKSYSTRKRLVGGFYSYDSYEKLTELGTLCQGETDAKGVLSCGVTLDQSGSVELYAQAKDQAGRVSRAATTVWVAGGEAWWGGQDDDRIDIIPTKKTWMPGETAEFQVRMPFRQARALVALEREGVLETQVVDLSGDNPMIRLPVQASWGPNVYVSVLAVRGRIRQVPWSSFFSWGWKQPMDWYRVWSTQVDEVPAPTALVDLAKPSFRFGLVEIRVSDEQDRLNVQVSADRQTYQIRETAHVEVTVQLPDGEPAARGTVAFAAVDEALLTLWHNQSWDVLDAMRVLRSYGVATATGQSEVVGRRHYGRKAVPAGGGGGFSPTRELLDTLLLWRTDVELDSQGRARIEVPLNDALTQFRLVAIADFGEGRFGSGFTDIISTQDLQVIPGLPLVVRSGDKYQALATVRNRTERAMTVRVSAQVQDMESGALDLPGQDLLVEAGQAAQLNWQVIAPESSDQTDGTALNWTFSVVEQSAQEVTAKASDRVVMHQRAVPAVPVEVQQATLDVFDETDSLKLPVSPPALALKDRHGKVRGGMSVVVQSSLAGGLPGVRDWFDAYPYTCLEQLSSRSMGRRNQVDWDALMQRLPTYLDENGLAAYFPGGKGSVTLTAYLLSISEQARDLGWLFEIPGEARQRMSDSLLAFVQGRLEHEEWSPYPDDAWRQIIAIEALSRLELFQPEMLDTVVIDPNQWPSAVLVDWAMILTRSPDIPTQATYLEQVKQILRARLTRQGTVLVLSDETSDAGWWLMSNRETVQARLLIAMMDQSDWKRDLPLLAMGLLSIQKGGAWSTTTANLYGSLAINLFSQKYETTGVDGQVRLSLSDSTQAVQANWASMQESDGVRAQRFSLPWAREGRDILTIAQQGKGHAWATVQVRSAQVPNAPVAAGMALTRTVIPVSQAQPGVWARGDIYRVHLRIESKIDTVWAVLSDPIPAGATILGSGLGGDSALATMGEPQQYWFETPTFVERRADMFRAYYDVLAAGTTDVVYTVRLNTPGTFQLSPSRIEAMYQPDVFGSRPNQPFEVLGQ